MLPTGVMLNTRAAVFMGSVRTRPLATCCADAESCDETLAISTLSIARSRIVWRIGHSFLIKLVGCSQQVTIGPPTACSVHLCPSFPWGALRSAQRRA